MNKELPSYVSHKVVQATKIIDIATGDASARLHTEHGDIVVDGVYVMKHKPQPGGYYVLYADGYESWSPAEAFESGYTLLDEQADMSDDPIGVRLECLRQACMLANSIGDVEGVVMYADKMLKFVVEAKVS